MPARVDKIMAGAEIALRSELKRLVTQFRATADGKLLETYCGGKT